MYNQLSTKIIHSFLVGSVLISNQTFSAVNIENPADLWKGLYIGANLGGVVSNADLKTKSGNLGASTYFTTEADSNSVSRNGSSTLETKFLNVGFHAGNDWIYDKYILGAIIDYTYFNHQAHDGSMDLYPSSGDAYYVRTSIKVKDLYSLRARVGMQYTYKKPALLYATFGPVLAKLKVANRFDDSSILIGTGASSITTNQLGFSIGAGADYAINRQLSLNMEYKYINTPARTTTGIISNSVGGFGIPVHSLSNPFNTKANWANHMIKIGVNYRFNIV